MKRLLFIFALLCSPWAWSQTTYTTNTASAHWHTAAQFTPNGVPTGIDSVIIANGDTLTCEAGQTCPAASLTCSSGAGSGVFIISGTAEPEGAGPWNLCTTITLNPQSAVATATAAFTRGSATATLSSVTGTIAYGDLVWPVLTSCGGVYPATFANGFSTPTLTMSQPAFLTGSCQISFFPPSILFNSSTSYPINIGYQNGGSSGPYPLMQVNGTISDPVGVTTASGSANFGGFSSTGSYQMTGIINGTYLNVNNAGSSSVASWYPNYFYYGNTLSVACDYCAFDHSGRITPNLTASSGSISFSFTHGTVTNTIDSAGIPMDVTTYSPVTFATGSILGNYFDGDLKEDQGDGSYYGADDGLTVSNNIFAGTSSVGPYNGGVVGHASGHFDGNIFFNQEIGSAGATFPAGSITRAMCVLTGNPSGGPTHIDCGANLGYAAADYNGGLVDREYNDGSGYEGTSSCIVISGVAYTLTFEGWVVLPTPAGYSSCAFINVVGAVSAGQHIIATHNTLPPTPVANGFAAFVGEGTTAQLNLYQTIENNLFYLPASTAGAAYDTYWYPSFTPVNGTFGTVDYNDQWNITGSPYTSVYGGSSSWYGSTPGVHDLNVNPQFVSATRNLGTWATAQGITWSTWADIINYGFKCMNAPVGCPFNNASALNYYYWTQTGFSPQNSSLLNAGSDSKTIGGVPWSNTSLPSLFSGLLNATACTSPYTNGPCVDYTTNGTVWTYPGAPAAGSSYFDTTWNVNQYRIPTPTGTCAVVSTYNPTGNCAITTTKFTVDYPKVIPWTVDSEYYVAPEQNFWLYIYSRSGVNTYSYVRLLQTGSSSYGSTRDHSNGEGLAGDDSNWEVAKNASTPHLIYYTGSTIASGTRTQLKAYNIDTDTITLIHDFASTIATVNGWGTCSVTATTIDNQREGNQSDDDRYWAFGVTDASSNGWCAILVYDKTTDTVVALQTLGANGMCGVSSCNTLWPGNGYPNWVGMSPSGQYVIVNWQSGAYVETYTGRGEGTEVYTNTLGYVGVASPANGHGDVGWDENGQEVYVDQATTESPNGEYAFGVCNIATANSSVGATGCRHYLSVPCSWGSYSCPGVGSSRGNEFYISGRGTHNQGQGWFLLSTQADNPNLTGNGGWGALENDAMLLSWLAGSTDVLSNIPPAAPIARLGRNHAIYAYDMGGDGDYPSQSNAVPDWTFSKIAWTSNWDTVPLNCGTAPYCNYYNMITEFSSTPPSYTLTVSTTTGTGTGTINITNNCQTGSFTSGTTIGPCTATPNAGSVFAGWTGTLGCTGTGTCTASLTGDSTMIATFNTSVVGPPINLQGGLTILGGVK